MLGTLTRRLPPWVVQLHFPPILSLSKVTYEANSYSIPVANKATVSVDVKQHFNSYSTLANYISSTLLWLKGLERKHAGRRGLAD